jgi:hypothetical protein
MSAPVVALPVWEPEAVKSHGRRRAPTAFGLPRANEGGDCQQAGLLKAGDLRIRGPADHLYVQSSNPMRSSFDFRLPTKSTSVPATPDWLHEVKYDGYRLRLDVTATASV